MRSHFVNDRANNIGMLKRIFTSNTRIKLLTLFILNEDEEFYIREITRKLDEQINSIRRELDNLKKAGFLKSKLKNRKKFYVINKSFYIYPELKGIIKKSLSEESDISKELEKYGKIKLLVLSGVFIEKETESVDMLIVGQIDRTKLTHYLNNELSTPRPVKFAIISEEDFRYRINLNDKFIKDLTQSQENKTPIKNIAF
jgi:DNA-binding transcriptional ArsR family regulator